jgi:hypothetical protein
MPSAFRVQSTDNVATLLDDAIAGEPIRVVGSDVVVVATQPISAAHKVALLGIPRGAAVIKFGIEIGIATEDIRAGDWVHLHNIRSGFDQRSATLDVRTGAVTDTRYE